MIDNYNKKFWERFAKLYTIFQEKQNKKLYKELCNKIKPLIHQDKKVLELACGTGQLAISLASSSEYWVATDFSHNMIKEAKKRLELDNVLFEVQDATNLSYENQLFDIVIIANALHIMPNPDLALKEIKRVLKPEGILIAPTFVYEGKVNKVRLWLMEKMGFKTFYKWTTKEYITFIEAHDFFVTSNELIDGKPLSECILVCQYRSL